jgi:hypothetical protein
MSISCNSQRSESEQTPPQSPTVTGTPTTGMSVPTLRIDTRGPSASVSIAAKTPVTTSKPSTPLAPSVFVSELEEWKLREREKIRREVEARALQEAEMREGIRLQEEERERRDRQARERSNDVMSTNQQGRLWRAAFSEFLITCEEQSRILIDELSLPYHNKSLRPINPTSSRYIIKNITLQIAEPDSLKGTFASLIFALISLV